jgi:hypothetical protein
MAAGLGFKTFTTGEVLTAADTNGYLMQGILVFASAAARDAAITSPQEGQACYLKDTNEVLTYSGSAWVAVGGSGGMTLINTGGTTLTGASITISSIPATYVDLYLVIRNGRTATSGANFLMRINSDTANRYDENSANTIANGTFPNSSWMIAFNSDSGASTSLATVSIFDYANTTTWKSATNLSITNNPGVPANFNAIRYMQFYNQTPAISSLTIFPSAGNWTSGTAYLYGVK